VVAPTRCLHAPAAHTQPAPRTRPPASVLPAAHMHPTPRGSHSLLRVRTRPAPCSRDAHSLLTRTCSSRLLACEVTWACARAMLA
jgi:hypothetical protein